EQDVPVLGVLGDGDGDELARVVCVVRLCGDVALRLRIAHGGEVRILEVVRVEAQDVVLRFRRAHHETRDDRLPVAGGLDGGGDDLCVRQWNEYGREAVDDRSGGRLHLRAGRISGGVGCIRAFRG